MKLKPFSTVLIVIGILVSVVFYSFGQRGKTQENVVEETTNIIRENVCCAEPQQVNSVRIAENYTFAGQTVPFTRFDVRQNLDRELLAFTYMHSTTLLLIKRANLYFPVIEPILKEHGIPDDFKYLALIESHFNPRAVSPVKAVGIWQFMEETGKEYGLEISNDVDERLDLHKSTVAACRYLRRAYDMYGCWIIAAASYNGGKGRMTRELERQKVSSFFDLFLNEETTRYIYRLFASKEVISNPAKYGFCLQKEDFYHTVGTKTYVVNTPVENWADWAKERGTTYGQLRNFNPWIRGMELHNRNRKAYNVQVPNKKDLDFDIKKVKIHNQAWLKCNN